jgi:transcriptional regulator with XRE-family HTH domain
MRERLLKFLELENLTSAKFADDIGVQRSSISHILSGRNNPSYDFIQKILQKYKSLNPEWLILGTGSMTKPITQGELFEKDSHELNESINDESAEKKVNSEINNLDEKNIKKINTITNRTNIIDNLEKNKNIEKIILLFKDKTFDIYLSSK